MVTITRLESQDWIDDDVRVPLGIGNTFTIIGTGLTDANLKFYVSSDNKGANENSNITIQKDSVKDKDNSETTLHMIATSKSNPSNKNWVAIDNSNGNIVTHENIRTTVAVIDKIVASNGDVNDVKIPLGSRDTFTIIGNGLDTKGLHFYVSDSSKGTKETESIKLEVDTDKISPTKIAIIATSDSKSKEENWVAIKNSAGKVEDTQSNIRTV